MNNVNMAVIAGRLVRDPELKATTGGTSVLEFSIAFNTSRKNQDGSYAEESNFIDCSVFGSFGETLARYMRKGMKVTVAGSLKQERWVSKDGQNRSRIRLRVNDVELPDKGQSAPQQEQQAQPEPEYIPF